MSCILTWSARDDILENQNKHDHLDHFCCFDYDGGYDFCALFWSRKRDPVRAINFCEMIWGGGRVTIGGIDGKSGGNHRVKVQMEGGTKFPPITLQLSQAEGTVPGQKIILLVGPFFNIPSIHSINKWKFNGRWFLFSSHYFSMILF